MTKAKDKGGAIRRRNDAVRPALDRDQKKLLAEAIRLAEETRHIVEDALVGYGRWLLVNVFEDDTSRALEGKMNNPIWRELINRAGGPTVRMSQRMMYTALLIAVHDKRITDESWRNLEPGRKELLLPLGDERLMQKAAKYVTAMKLSHRATRAYVAELRAAAGRGVGIRLSARRLVTRVRTFRETFAKEEVERRIERVCRTLEAPEKKDLLAELRAVRAWTDRVMLHLNGAPAKKGVSKP